MYLIYNLLLFLALPFVVAYHLYRSLSRGRPAALAERFGFIGRELRAAIQGPAPIWVHAVSVGETIAVKPLLRALKERFPHRRLILSAMTETGLGVARQVPEVECCIRFPFDYPWAVRRLLRLIRPALVVIVETELWPNFLREARLLGVPTLIANGRISDRSFGRYLSCRSLFRPVLANVSSFCMQSAEDGRRITAMGADPYRVRTTGNLKFDIPVPTIGPAEKDEIRSRFRLPHGIFLLVAGSTHDGEEGAVVAAFTELLRSGQPAVLVLVPRHPERAGEVANLLRQAGLRFVLRSRLEERENGLGAGEVLLVDTIGELMRLYAVADLVFVGGSLVPVGGHNVLEPASLGVPVLFGPHMANFRDIAGLILSYGGARQVADGAGLAAACVDLAADEGKRRELGDSGRRLVNEEGGATQRHLAAIAAILGEG